MKINVSTHFRVLSDSRVFAKNEIYMNERLIKQFLQALEIKQEDTKQRQSRFKDHRNSVDQIQYSLNQVKVANDRLFNTFIKDTEAQNIQKS